MHRLNLPSGEQLRFGVIDGGSPIVDSGIKNGLPFQYPGFFEIKAAFFSNSGANDSPTEEADKASCLTSVYWINSAPDKSFPNTIPHFRVSER